MLIESVPVRPSPAHIRWSDQENRALEVEQSQCLEVNIQNVFKVIWMFATSSTRLLKGSTATTSALLTHTAATSA